MLCVYLFHSFHRLQGETAIDTLRQWQRTYSRELDQDTRQECIAIEKLLRKALAGGGEAFFYHHTMFTIQNSKNFFNLIQKLLCNVTCALCSSRGKVKEPHVGFSLPFKYPFTLFPLSPSTTVPAAPAPAKLFDALQDSQLFDAEASEPLSSSGGDCSSRQDWLRNKRNSEVKASPASSRRWQSNVSTQRHRARGTEAAVLYGVISGEFFLYG